MAKSKANQIETLIAAEPVSAAQPIVDRVGNKFFLVHFPCDWKMCVSGKNKGKWIPTLNEIPYVRGLNGVVSDNPGPAITHVTNTKARKAIFIDHLKDPRVGKDLIRSFKARSKTHVGDYFVTKFSTASIDYNGHLKLEVDQEAYQDFCLGLVANEVIPDIDEGLVRSLIEQTERLVDQLESGNADNRPGIEKSRKAKRTLLELMQQSVNDV